MPERGVSWKIKKGGGHTRLNRFCCAGNLFSLAGDIFSLFKIDFPSETSPVLVSHWLLFPQKNENNLVLGSAIDWAIPFPPFPTAWKGTPYLGTQYSTEYSVQSRQAHNVGRITY